MKNDYKNDKIVNDIMELQKEEEELTIANMPTFERGVTEAAIEREFMLWQDLMVVFKSHGVVPSHSSLIESANQPSVNANRPDLVCGGVRITLQYLVPPMDATGKDGKMPNDVYEKIGEIRLKIEELKKGFTTT